MPPGEGTQRTKVLMLVTLERGVATPPPLGLGCKVKEGILENRMVHDRHLKAQHAKGFGVMVE